MNMNTKTNGFTVIEILIVLAVITILATIGSQAFRGKALDKEIEATSDALVARLELAKSNAISGKDGQNYGLKFDSDSYTYFVGSSYISTNEGNEVTEISSKLEIINDIPGSTDQIVFSKINGDSNHASDVTVTIRESNNHDNKIDVIIGTLGEISVIK